MKKFRIMSIALFLVLALNILSGTVVCASTLRASPTLNAYSAIITKGNSTGKIVITYDVAANTLADSVGVSSMKIYKSDGSYVTTITATSLNRFTDSGVMSHRNSYTYTGTSGTSYYAEVTVFATIKGVTDSRTITPNTVKAP